MEYEEGSFHVVMVGRLAHEKGVERALQAAAYAAEKSIPVVLHIVGDGKMTPELKQTASLLKLQEHAVFLRRAEKSVPFYGQCGSSADHVIP